LVQAERNGWKGATGAQFFTRRFEAIGEEAYIPLNTTDQVGLFTLQSFDLGGVRAEVAGRWENTSVGSAPVGIRRNFNAFSASAGVSVPLGEGFRWAASIAHVERAPSGEELFADGAHIATRAFEIGDPNLNKERSIGVESVLRGRGDGWRLEISGFFSRFSNFIFLAPTGEMDEGLPVFEYGQAGARYWGAEAEGAVTVAQLGDTRFDITGLADFVRADLLGGRGPAPRIPPMRFIGGVEANGGAIGGRVEVEHVTRQTRVAAFETETPAFTMVNASLAWRPFGAGNPTSIIASVNNLFDVEARRHASFLKDVAPLFGRDFRLAARVSF
jgi:iron complex outermembrane receptor protein